MGRIGQALARRARAFGMQVHYHNRKRLRPEIEESLEATYWESLDQMVSRMDVISINCPHTPLDLPSDERAPPEIAQADGGDREHLARRGD